jgi:hypothetical protein
MDMAWPVGGRNTFASAPMRSLLLCMHAVKVLSRRIRPCNNEPALSLQRAFGFALKRSLGLARWGSSLSTKVRELSGLSCTHCPPIQ